VGAANTTVYYLPGTGGWSLTLAGRPTAQWHLPNPVILTGRPHPGIQTNGFSFTISWATNSAVVVEASTSPGGPAWIPLWTNDLVNGTAYFSDAEWTNYSHRFYRLRAQ